jgi:GT2 family glycosyltransferase
MGRGTLAAVGGNQVSPDDETAFGRTVNEFLKAVGFVADYVKAGDASGLRETGHNPTCNAMYRRDVFTEVGNFKAGLWPGEDVEFDRRLSLAGYRFLYNPRAVVAHYRTDTALKFARMMYRYGMAQAYLVRHYGFFRKIHAVPLLFWGYCVFVGIVVFQQLPVGWLIAVPLLAVLALLMMRTGKLLKSVVYFFLFAATIIAWNLGFVRGLAGMGKKV